jgi:hypothetical protein
MKKINILTIAVGVFLGFSFCTLISSSDSSYTKEYLAGNIKMEADVTAPNVNTAGGIPDPNLGFDITVTLPNNVVANPTVMIWGYWVDNVNNFHGIQKIATVLSQAGKILTINCMVHNLAGELYDKGVFGGNWASRTLYLHYVVINY